MIEHFEVMHAPCALWLASSMFLMLVERDPISAIS